jgi:histidinol phosphatase-like PHP family hydrolase
MHIHTTYSDSRIVLQDAVEKCKSLRLEVIAFTDHFWPSLGSQRGGINLIKRRREEINTVRNEYPQLRILDGAEVDITMNGGLENVAGGSDQFDIVIGSIHHFLDSAKWIRTLERTLENDTFDILGHWDGYLRNFSREDGERAAQLLAENNVAIEISSRYECQWEYFFEIARDAGCKFTLGSDAHWIEAIERFEKQRNILKAFDLELREF